MTRLIPVLTMSIVISACGRQPLQDNEGLGAMVVDPVEASVESGLTMISAVADEESGSSLALKTNAEEMRPNYVQLLLVGEKAYAASCWRPYYSPCVDGLKTADYDNCGIPNTSRTVDGQAALAYSQLNCSLASEGDTVQRTYGLAITGPRGGVVSLTSANQADYRGISYGGGGRLTKVSGGYELDVLGRHTSFVYRSRSIYSTSVRTLAPISVTGGLARATRRMTGGQLEVNHNIAGFTALFTASNLGWSSNCCHPTSGSLSVTYSGSRNGGATVTFSGCGTATVDQGGQQSTLQMSYCE